MVRLRIVLGVASSLVAIAALTIVFSGIGEAQGNPKETNVVVTNTPLPVTGNITATIPGSINATVSGQVTVSNPSNNPVLIRNVDAQVSKELWQTNKSVIIADNFATGSIEFGDPVPAGKALVIEHVDVFFQNFDHAAPPGLLVIRANPFDGVSSHDLEHLVPQQMGNSFIANAATKFYVRPGSNLVVIIDRTNPAGLASLQARLTGFLVDYP